MKKSFILILIILLLTGCAKEVKDDDIVDGGEISNSQDENAGDSNDDSENQPSKEADSEGYSFTYNNIKISLNEESTSIIKGLGEAMEEFQAPSCAFQGMDMFYVFPGFELSTYPLEDSHYISTIDFIDDTVTTEKGLYIGSTLDDVIDKYGVGFEQSGSIYTYKSGDTSISFAINNDTVENITYAALVGEQN